MSPIKSLISLSSLVFLATLCGCGFEPLYAPKHKETVLAQLEHVKVDVIANRSGQILRTFLLDTMTEESHGDNRYILRVKLNESIRKLGFRRDGTSRHEEILIKATFQLEDLVTKKVVYTDTLSEIASFSLGPEARTASYSASVAEDSGREKALRILASNINLYVASYLLRKEES